MAQGRLQGLANSLRAAIESQWRGVCAACERETTSRHFCEECRSASAMAGVWRVRRVDAQSDPLLVYSLGRYRGYGGDRPSPGATALMRFKYGGDRAAGRAFTRAVRECAPLDAASGAVIVPIPLHPRRFRSRGFNQAAWVARAIAVTSGARIAPDALVCVADGPSRARLSRAARRAASPDRFRTLRALAPDSVVLLVDDVCTTGTTLSAARRVLESAGVHVRAAAVLLSTERDDDSESTGPS